MICTKKELEATMNSIITEHYPIHFNTKVYTELALHLAAQNYSMIFILVDTNTYENCLPHLMSELSTEIPIEIIEIEAGEIHKSIDTCVGVWESLSELGADRNSVMINLGGGVVTDLGGFVASTFKRGISYINIPTTLLAMVDASVGGKTGVDLGSLKNQVGLISNAELVLIDTHYLSTLAQNQMKSGLAEMLKHGLIYDREYWNVFLDLSQLDASVLDLLIYQSVLIKQAIVSEDPTEQNIRKHLNFGHTLGHAIESYFLEQTERSPLLHGEAIAMGMLLESFISQELLDFPKADLKEISQRILELYPKVDVSFEAYNAIIEFLKYDKKNSHGQINFVLLEAIGKPKRDCLVPNTYIKKAFEYYKTFELA